MSKGAKLNGGLYRRSLATLEPSCTLHQSLIGARREMPIDDQDNSRSLLDRRFNKGPDCKPVNHHLTLLEKGMSKTKLTPLDPPELARSVR
jgi:hypothetical protein